ncbi:cyclodeaminase/cyclohydrolase family protein [uncultured Anaerococcus sp.]|uniref:cyclodeaminase/cyclohydrolase family protein n=1 Tax=uncultured Anaerococcus sp. TaxID=293428 RepID=UPI00288BDF05|nr:cyclodeaminase/cyclohydrolase family protein [uncultured Anaerococcus sp.]
MKINDLRVGELIEETRKVNAKPGGGAIVILSANLAVNLGLMLDKNDWGELGNEAREKRKVMEEISDLLSKCADEDIYYANLLIDQYKNKGPIDEKFFIDASKPQIRLNTLALKALELLGFFLDFGKASTLADGEIANEMLYNAIKLSLPTLKANLNETNYKYNIDEVLDEAYKLYQNNRNIIERRKA